MKAIIKIVKAENSLAIRTVIVLFLGFFSLVLSATNIKVTIITVDSLTGEKVNDHYVYIDYYNIGNNPFYLSPEDSNVSIFILDFTKKQSYNIRVMSAAYLESEFNLTCPTDCRDTTILIKLLYNFHPRQLPMFFFNRYDYYPDTTNLQGEMISLDYFINHILNKEPLIMQLTGCFYPDENDTNNVLAINRLHYIRDLSLNMGADSNSIEIKLLEYKPYQILFKEEITEFFKFRTVLDQSFIDKLPPDIKMQAERYNRRVWISVRSKK